MTHATKRRRGPSFHYGTTTIDFPVVDDARSEVVKNPNDEIRDQLSSEALAAYDRALYGAKPEETGGSVEEGCASGAAAAMPITETSVIGDAISAAGLDPLCEDLSVLTDRLRQSPRLDQPSAQWLSCMAEAGHFLDTAEQAPVAGPAEVDGMATVGLGRRDVVRRAEELTGWADLLDELPEDFSGEIEPPDIEIDPDELRDLQQHEIAVATTDHACRVEYFDQVLRDVRHELESEFVEAHRDELERFRDLPDAPCNRIAAESVVLVTEYVHRHGVGFAQTARGQQSSSQTSTRAGPICVGRRT